MASLHFLNPEFLVLLLGLPLIIVTYVYLYKFTKKKAMLFANLKTLQRVTGKKIMSKHFIVFLLRMIILALIIFSLSGPSIWYDGEEQKTDYIIAIDTSASMTATDLKPTRFEAAQTAATKFIEQINATAKIGVIGFSGTTSIEQTLTDDAEEAIKSINGLKIQTASGTDIAGALVTGTNLLAQSNKGKAIILFTDGSATVGTFIDDPITKGVQYAINNKVTVHAIGMGQRDSAPTGYLPRLYNITAVYNQENLEFISNRTGGDFAHATNDEQLDEAFDHVLRDPRSAIEVQELSLGLLLAALLLLFIEWGMINTRFRLIP